jgi:U3 small nucleolar RNA-associated protein 25
LVFAIFHLFREEFRDQGFTRPSVLIIVPFRNEALNIARYLFEASGRPQEENKKRFMDEFGPSEEDHSSSSSKPSDYCKLFEGNIDDCFRIGIKLTRRSLKLFTSFYGSDIILASPLGLRMSFEESTKKADHDFLSSLRYVVVDSADVLVMQNWDHLLHVFKHVNLIPKRSHDCDFGRVKESFLNGE